MDNLTHSLFGAAVAETFYHAVSTEEPKSPFYRKALWIVSILASNLPDIDFAWSGRIGPSPINYLLYHRGHSHTFSMAIPQALIVFAFALALLKFFKCDPLKRGERWRLLSLSVLGVVFHIGLDFLNSYGVHPFWPFQNRWYYGDTLFIIEPSAWLFILVSLLPSIRNRWARLGSIFILSAMVSIVLFSGYLPRGVIAVLLAVSIGLFATLRRLTDRHRAYTALGSFFLIVAIFAIQSFRVRSVFAEPYRDLILSPMPGNPLCWRAIGVEVSPDGKTYDLKRAMIATWPSLYSPLQCAKPIEPDVAKSEFRAQGGMELMWMGGVRREIEDLKKSREEYCDVYAFLKFSRAPFLREENGALWASDLRFDRGGRRGFGNIQVSPQKRADCSYVPEWTEPRSDLLHP